MRYPGVKLGLILTAIAFYSPFLDGSLEETSARQSPGSPSDQQTLEFRPQLVPLEGQLLNCQARRGGIRINFKGTELMPKAKGEVNAKSYEGSAYIQAKFDNLASPKTLGEQYMSYVLWSMTAKDSPVKIGELEFKDSRATLQTKTALQALALFVTVEPYSEVSRPSNLVALEQIVPHEIEEANTGVMTKTELLRDGYAPIGYTYEPLMVGIGQPLIFRQAMNARRIAQVARAEQYAPKDFREAESLYDFVVGTVLAQRKARKNDLVNAVTVIREYEEARAASIAQQNRSQP
jgi:hypothetical protein